ncbi:MAG TPA: phosphoribosyltransferase [Rickettsiales bacterium]|nr:phosphoribosyltransferase [Rickettsiales bacterium]
MHQQFMKNMRIHDRRQAGLELANRLAAHAYESETLVLALPRGGVPVAFEIARKLHLPMDVFLVRKLGLPGHEELAIGAIADGGMRVLNEDVLSYLPVDKVVIDYIAAKEEQELERRRRTYRDDKPFPAVTGKQIILVDDGLATGSTMRAALKALKRMKPGRIIVAVPVAPESALADLPGADETICLMMPEPFYSVGVWYEQFDQTSDQEVLRSLHEAERFIPSEAA